MLINHTMNQHLTTEKKHRKQNKKIQQTIYQLEEDIKRFVTTIERKTTNRRFFYHS